MPDPAITTVASVLELRAAERRFGGVRAVDGVTLRIQAGEVLALIGPNGAGKSTLFGLLMGELSLSAGEILCDGRDMRSLSPERRSRLGIGRTFQAPRLFAHLTVVENISIALLAAKPRLSRKAREGLLSPALVEVGLQEHGGLRASSLSQGQRKRLELAMVLALEPRVLLLDEPTAGMGAEERATIMQVVMDGVRRRRLTMLFTEHDMETVFTHAQRVVVMDRGVLVADGSPERVRADRTVQEIYLGAHPR